MSDAELERIRSAYRERDAAGNSPYRWDNPGYVGYMQELEQALLRAIGTAQVPLAGARVLDVGCGSGYFLHRLQEYGAGECHGIDLMENRIAEGRRRYPTVHFHIGSATELPFESGEFDLVTQFTCLSSIIDDDVRLAVSHEMSRVSAGGWIMSFDMRGLRVPSVRRPKSSISTPTVPLDEDELTRLFGEPVFLRRAALVFDVAQRIGHHTALGAVLRMVPFLRSHLLGVWRVPAAVAAAANDGSGGGTN
jgi:SAM-dependent methyltransferase